MTKEQQSVLHMLNAGAGNFRSMAGRLAKGSTVPDELVQAGWAEKVSGRYRITEAGKAALDAESAVSGGRW